jgi:hypothetical protein
MAPGAAVFRGQMVVNTAPAFGNPGVAGLALYAHFLHMIGMRKDNLGLLQPGRSKKHGPAKYRCGDCSQEQIESDFFHLLFLSCRFQRALLKL